MPVISNIIADQKASTGSQDAPYGLYILLPVVAAISLVFLVVGCIFWRRKSSADDSPTRGLVPKEDQPSTRLRFEPKVVEVSEVLDDGPAREPAFKPTNTTIIEGESE